MVVINSILHGIDLHYRFNTVQKIDLLNAFKSCSEHNSRLCFALYNNLSQSYISSYHVLQKLQDGIRKEENARTGIPIFR